MPVARYICFGIAGLLAGRILLGGDLAPFGTAFLIAAFRSAPRRTRFDPLPWLAFFGVITGLVTRLSEMQSIAFHFGTCGIAAVSCAAFSGTKLMRRHWFVFALVSLIYTICGLLFRRTLIMSLIANTVEAAACILLSIVFERTARLLLSKRRLLSDEEAMCAVFALLCCLLGLGSIELAGINLCRVAAVFLTLICACTGGPALGAGAGAAAGLAAALSGADVLFMANITACGMLCGICRAGKKPGTTAVFILLNAVLTFYLNGSAFVIMPLIDTAIGAAGYCLMPAAKLLQIRELFDANRSRTREQSLHISRFAQMTRGRMKRVARLLSGAGGVLCAERPEQGVSYMISAVPEAACGGCAFADACWEREFPATYKIMLSLYEKYSHGRSISAADLPRSFAARCMRTAELIRASRAVFDKYRENSLCEYRAAQARNAAGMQLCDAARAIESLLADAEQTSFIPALEENIRRELDHLGIRTSEICAGRDSSELFVSLRFEHCPGEGCCESTCAPAISRACGRRMIRYTSCRGGVCSPRFCEARPYRLRTASASLKKQGSEQSGDALMISDLPGSRRLMLLCDGMGSGKRAAAESAAAVRLTGDFLLAGLAPDDVVDSVNRLLILASSDEVYSTMDMCVVDETDGSAVFTKIGSPHSYIVRSGRVMRIEPGALPIGIVEECEPVRRRLQLEHGDTIVMMTDGVTDAGEDISPILSGSDIQAAAQAVLEAALTAYGGQARDDMTVIVCTVA